MTVNRISMNPTPQARQSGRAAQSEPADRFERSDADVIADLRQRVAKLERELHPPPPPVETADEREARYLREGGGH